MIHYLSNTGIDYTAYKEIVQTEHTDFRHLFFPSNTREGVEIIELPVKEEGDKKVL